MWEGVQSMTIVIHFCYYCNQSFVSNEEREKHLIDKHPTTKDQIGNQTLTLDDHEIKFFIQKKYRANLSKKMLDNKQQRVLPKTWEKNKKQGGMMK